MRLRQGDGGRSDRGCDQSEPRTVENEGFPRLDDDVARIIGLGDPNDANDTRYGQPFAVVNVEQTVCFQFDWEIRCFLGHGSSPMNPAHAKVCADA